MNWIIIASGILFIAILLRVLSRTVASQHKLDEVGDNEDLQRIYNQTIDLLKERKYYLNKSLKLSDLAKELGYKDRLLSRAINAFSSDNFNSFINSFRVEYSKSLLIGGRHDHYTIEAIAEESGFSNKVSFYKAFKKETEMSPSEFRHLKQLK